MQNFDFSAIKKIAPGLTLSTTVAIISHLIAKILPQLGAATIALLLGILLGNFCFKQPLFQNGTKFAESNLLEIAVSLLGFSITIEMLVQLNINGVFFIICTMASVIIYTYLLGKKLQFDENTALLMAGGNAICGSSAIGALAPVINADDETKGEVVTTVNLLGTLLMFILPMIANFFFSEQQPILIGAFLGGILPSVGQVAASAQFFNEEIVQFAMLFKIFRILMLILIVYSFEQFSNRNNRTNQQKRSKRTIPWYISAFFIFFIIHQVITLPAMFLQIVYIFRQWCETVALAAIGLRLNLRQFMNKGKKYSMYGIFTGTFQIVICLILGYLLLT